MRPIYQIKRTELGNLDIDDNHRVYRFELINEMIGSTLCTANAQSPIAPKWMRIRQAQLNTVCVLELGAFVR